jgi:hypothetical protein
LEKEEIKYLGERIDYKKRGKMKQFILLLLMGISSHVTAQDCSVKVESDFINDSSFRFFNHRTGSFESAKDYFLNRMKPLGHQIHFKYLDPYDFKVTDFDITKPSSIFIESKYIGIRVLDSRGYEVARDMLLWCVQLNGRDCKPGYNKFKDLNRRIKIIKKLLMPLKC